MAIPVSHDGNTPKTVFKSELNFEPGDKVRIVSYGFAREHDVYDVDFVTETHLRVSNGTSHLFYRRGRFVHA